MKIAAAQIEVKDKNIDFNIQQHLKACRRAYEEGVRLIAFPEMSLTGYLREEAEDYAFYENDERLKPIMDFASNHEMIIVAGAPISIAGKLYIGEFIIYPHRNIQLYTKQYLHEGEDVAFCSSFEYNPQIKLGDDIISLAICADVENPQHPKDAKINGANLYIPSVFYLDTSMTNLHKKLADYAKGHSMNILLSNFIGQSYNMNAGGKIAFWNDKGELLSEANNFSNELIIVEKRKNEWIKTDGNPFIF